MRLSKSGTKFPYIKGAIAIIITGMISVVPKVTD